MKIDFAQVRSLLKAADFETLFREQLGWDNHKATLDIPLNETTYRLSAVAQKRGFVAYLAEGIPDRQVRLKIDHQVAKSTREHFVIYRDPASGRQVWQWVRREPGKPLASRDHVFEPSGKSEALIQRLEQIAVSLDEEEKITVVDVAGRARAAFDVEKITKQFYDRFKTEHAAFMKFIKGIKADADLQWYTSLMLNRLMFVYFIQKKGFLDGDANYLRNRLAMVRQAQGKDKFQSFYRYFLLRLFHDGLGKAPGDRQPELDRLLGKVPYLNGGFFEVHQLEERNTEIDIPDKAFEILFDFFDEYRWHLDERPRRADNEINPDVVGYIFEKYINQKQMGAYYTKEDITEYISKNTIIPFLFDAAEKECAVAFKPDGALWRLLQDDPDRYIYTAVRHGVVDAKGDTIALPAEIEAGVQIVSKRDGWNKPAVDPYCLPMETWREHVARRTRCLELRQKLKAGEVHAINDLVTLNLDLWQFARDAIVNSEGPELLRAFWHAIEKLTVLDPTCGSGAFLFAGLRILETLYSDCLERMERFIEEADQAKVTTIEDQVRALIAAGEGAMVEFKSSARWDVKENKYNPVMEEVIVKTVAGFLNGYGGTLLIGMDDSGKPVGLEKDYLHTKKENPNRDQFELWLNQYLGSKLSKTTRPYFHVAFARLDGHDVCRVTVHRSPSPVFVDKGGQEVLYARQGNATTPFNRPSDILTYTQQHWPANQPVPAPPPPPSPYSAPPVKPLGKLAYGDFRQALALIDKHPSREYFVLKSIIINNLFGVDIMEEAVEICKLRLFLKLVAQVETVGQIEPLPDIDFNIRAGNTLVGYASLEQVRRTVMAAVESYLPGTPEVERQKKHLERIEEDAANVERCFKMFRAQQTTHGGKVTQTDKQELRRRLAKLDNELNRYLAGECGVDVDRKAALAEWAINHEPFHWFVDFYGIMRAGGFHVIIGNPPYADVPKGLNRALLHSTYKTALERWSRDEDLYTMIVERAFGVLSTSHGQFGMILPLSLAFSTKSPFITLRQMCDSEAGGWWWSHFDRIPSSLFGNDVRTRCTVAVFSRNAPRGLRATTPLLRWTHERRDDLFALLRYAVINVPVAEGIPKVSSQIQADTLSALACKQRNLGQDLLESVSFTDLAAAAPRFPQPAVFVGGVAYNWFPAWRDIPETTTLQGQPSLPARTAGYRFANEEIANVVFAMLCSSMGYWWWAVASDGFNLKKWLLERFPLSISSLSPRGQQELGVLGASLRQELRRHYVYKDNKGRVGNYFLPACAVAIREIDAALAKHVPCLSQSFFEDIAEFNATFSRAEIDSEGDDD